MQAKLDGVNDFLNQYTYDALNRITRIQQQGTAVPKRFDLTYDAASQFATLARYQNLSGTAAVVTSTYTWDAAGRLTDLDHGTLVSYGWSYDAANRLGKSKGSGLFDSFARRSDSLTALHNRTQRRGPHGSPLLKGKR